MDTPRPAAQLVADAAREWVARNYGPAVVPVVVTIRLSTGEEIPLPVAAVFAPPVYRPSPAEGPPGEQRDRNVSDDCLGDILSLLADHDSRMTTEQIIKGLERAGHAWNETAVKRTLAHFKRAGQLTNDPKAKPPGYGLPEWSE